MATDANGSATTADKPADAGIPDPSKGGGGQGSTTTASSDPFAGLQDAGIREWVGKQGLKDLSPSSFEAIAKKAHAAESLIGRSVQLPGADAKPEDFDKVLDKVTANHRPKEAAGYEFKLPEGLPENFAYDKTFADEVRGWAHDGKLTTRQAALLHDRYVGKMAAAHKAEVERVGKELETATTELEAKWGPQNGEKFKEQVALADKALRGLGLEEPFKKLGALSALGDKSNIVRDSRVALALAEIGGKLFKEGSFEGGGGGAGAGNNPFKDGPGKGNLTEQMMAVKKDKAGAIALIRQAGHQPSDFGLTE